jgi:hypothetical protein
MRGHEARPQRGEVQQAEGHGHAHLEHPHRVAAARAHLGLGFVQRAQHFLAAGMEHVALPGEREPARGAVEQAHAQPRFQVRHLARDRGLGHLQRIRAADETAGLHHRDEGAHFLEAVHIDPVSETVNCRASSLCRGAEQRPVARNCGPLDAAQLRAPPGRRRHRAAS